MKIYEFFYLVVFILMVGILACELVIVLQTL